MISDSVKKAIALIATVTLLYVAYIGSYLPMRKSQAYIATLRNMGNIRSIDEFKSAFQAVFDIRSPIGQEELVRNMASTVVSIISNPQVNPAIVEPLVQFTEDSFRPIIASDRGMSFSQNLYVLANIHQAAFLRTNDARHLAAARIYYEWGEKRGPERPQFLYGLLDIYRMQGDADSVKRVSDKILSLWPDDDSVREAVAQFSIEYAARQKAASNTVQKAGVK